jgi:prepilin-type processing-associated H-X9-DG protein
LGTACHDVVGRTLAMLDGEAPPAEPRFAPATAVPNAGVLVAIPALVECGLFHELGAHLHAPRGYYGLPQLVLLLAMLTLTRVLSLERLREEPCGEWGRLLGLDRIPEVRTLRTKIGVMVTAAGVAAWAEALSRHWMRSDPDLAGVLYVDGHVRAYHGDQTRLPERFSSRDRLCVRSLMDYWICDRDGKPFFVVTAVGTEGMIHHLRSTIIPRLLAEVPGQPSAAELAADPDRHRFLVVFDREGYSPALFAQLWADHRIACVTYRKGAYEPWEHARFATHTVTLPFANQVEMDLAESCDTTIATVPLREIRRLSTDRTHQTALITTCRSVPMVAMAAHLFARWSQENFLNFATRDLDIDRLAGYQPEAAPADTEVRNPAWRVANQRVQRLRSDRAAIIAERGRCVLIGDEDADVAAYLARSAALQQRLDACQANLDTANADLRALKRRLPLSQIPEADRPKVISPDRMRFITTLKIVAYRAESAVCSLLRQHLPRSDEARTLAKAIWAQPADLQPDYQAGTLTVRLHHFPSPHLSRQVAHLLEHLNQADAEYPGTGLRLRYDLVSATIPGDPGP